MLRDGMVGDWIGTFLGHKGAIWQARLSADSDLAATASADFSAKVWNTRTGEDLVTLKHDHIVRAVAFPPGPFPRLLATGGYEKKLRIFDLSHLTSSSSSTGPVEVGLAHGNGHSEQLHSYEIGQGVHQGTIKSIVWSENDPNTLITAADDKKIRWWDIPSQKCIGEYETEGPIGSCELNAIVESTSPPTRGILSVAAGKTVYFFSGGSQPAELIKKHDLGHELTCVAVNTRDGVFVTGGAKDTWVRKYDFETGREIEVGKGHHGPVWSVAFSPDGHLYATGSEDGTVKLWKHGWGSYGLWRPMEVCDASG